MPGRPSDILGSVVPSRVLRRIRRSPIFVIRIRNERVKIIDRHNDGSYEGWSQICHCRELLPANRRCEVMKVCSSVIEKSNLSRLLLI
jgi:hypothetical protein